MLAVDCQEIQLKLLVYGIVCDWVDTNTNERIYLKRFEPDIEKIYREADSIINPVRFGAGIKIKNIVALANGIPLVTTTHGARGLEVMIDKGMLVADEPNDQINALCILIENPGVRKEMSELGYRYILQNSSIEICFQDLIPAIGQNSM